MKAVGGPVSAPSPVQHEVLNVLQALAELVSTLRDRKAVDGWLKLFEEKGKELAAVRGAADVARAEADAKIQEANQRLAAVRNAEEECAARMTELYAAAEENRVSIEALDKERTALSDREAEVKKVEANLRAASEDLRRSKEDMDARWVEVLENKAKYEKLCAEYETKLEAQKKLWSQ